MYRIREKEIRVRGKEQGQYTWEMGKEAMAKDQGDGSHWKIDKEMVKSLGRMEKGNNGQGS